MIVIITVVFILIIVITILIVVTLVITILIVVAVVVVVVIIIVIPELRLGVALEHPRRSRCGARGCRGVEGPRVPSTGGGTRRCGRRGSGRLGGVTDGIGTPDPNPRNLVN